MSITSIYHSLWIKKLSMAIVVASSGFAFSHAWSASVDQPALPINPDAVAEQVLSHIPGLPTQSQVMSQVSDAQAGATSTVATAQGVANSAQSFARAQADAAVAQAKSTVASTKSQVEGQVADVQSQANDLVDQATGTVDQLQGQVDSTIASLPTVDQITGQVTSLIPGQLPITQEQVLDAANGNLPHVSGGATVNNNGTSPSYTINLSVSK